MKYTKTNERYRYKLAEDEEVELTFNFCQFEHCFFAITGNKLLIKKGYKWDGASGPAIDTDSNRLATLVHDALYQLIREQILPYSYRLQADLELYKLMLQYGTKHATSKIGLIWTYVRAYYFFLAVRIFGRRCAVANKERTKVKEVK
jgi:hypothetical protein